MKIAVIKDDIVFEFFDENHPFSKEEIQKFTFKKVENSEVEKIKKDIKNYQITNKAIGRRQKNVTIFHDGVKLGFR